MKPSPPVVVFFGGFPPHWGEYQKVRVRYFQLLQPFETVVKVQIPSGWYLRPFRFLLSQCHVIIIKNKTTSVLLFSFFVVCYQAARRMLELKSAD
jgi:hypothetical protein